MRKRVRKPAYRVTRIYDIETGERIKFSEAESNKRYRIRHKTGTVRAGFLPKYFVQDRPRIFGKTVLNPLNFIKSFSVKLIKGHVLRSLHRSRGMQRFITGLRKIHELIGPYNILLRIFIKYTPFDLGEDLPRRENYRDMFIFTGTEKEDIYDYITVTALLEAQDQGIAFGKRYVDPKKYDNFKIATKAEVLRVTPKRAIRTVDL